MKHTLSIMKRELAGYFTTPVAYVFIVIFLLLSGVFTFTDRLGDLYGTGQASLEAFFGWHPWLYLFLIPAISMRLWAEERKLGTIELLMTLPVTLFQAILGKFLAAWLFAGTALALTFPTWVTVNVLGDPDNGAILAGYIGSFLMAGGFLAIGSAVSAFTKNQVIAFVISVVVCFVFLLPDLILGFLDWTPGFITDAVQSFSFQAHFRAISKGVLDVRDVVFFATLIALFLFVNALVLDLKKAD